MRILITSSRLPFAIDEVRKLGERGHEVFCADTFATAPGSHSRHVSNWFVTASPRYQPGVFLRDILTIIRRCSIDLLLPAFEEAMWLARMLPELSRRVEVFVSSYETMHRLHNKASFLELARQQGVPVPSTTLARSRRELEKQTQAHERFFARPAYSRAGAKLYTNVPPLDEVATLDQCVPSEENPWLVQPHLEGHEVCTFSVVHQGEIAAHACYVHPLEIDNAGGIVFESIDHPAAFEAASKIIQATKYTGQISFDFLETEEGLFAIECNPRPTAGVVVMSGDDFEIALRDRHPIAPRMTPAGVRRKLSLGLLREMTNDWKLAPEAIKHLMSSADDIYYQKGDAAPLLCTLLSYGQVAKYRMTHDSDAREAMLTGYLDDISYNGTAA